VTAGTGTSGRLAIDGGTPVRATLLPYAHQVIDDRDIAAVTAALRSDWLTTGPRIGLLEERLTEVTGARHAVLFSSGTAALHGAAAVSGLAPGDEGITTPMTFIASANAILYVGGTPRFADVVPGALLIDPNLVEAAIGPRTRAIVAVDYAGQPADYPRLRAIADRAPNGPLTIIADASHSLGATLAGRRVGTLADLTVLSLHPAKLLTTGEGGAVLTDDDDRAAGLRRFRNHGIDAERAARRDWTYAMVELGYNYRLSDVAAALGLAQLERFDEWLARRRALAARYFERLGGHPLVELPTVSPEAKPAWHFMFGLLRLDRLRVDRGQVFHALRAEGIGVNVHYIPVHRHPFYEARYPGLSMPVAEAAYDRLLTLPLHAGMSDADLDDVVAAVGKVTTAYARS
jgi:perosamine synthetase